MRPRLLTVTEAVDGLREGALVGTGGALLNRKPMALVRALAEVGKPVDLVTFLASTDAELLAETGVLRKLTATYCGLERMGRATAFEKAVEEGRVEWFETSEWLLLEGFRAAAMGLPFLPGRSGRGSDLPASRDLREVTDPYTGELLVAHPAIRPDLALIHAWRADQEGNVQLPFPPDHLWDVDLHLARAARRTVVSVEEIVSVEDVRRSAHLTRLTRIEVDAIVLAPGGARPTACRPVYEEALGA
jgi:glutaconate CoA-transferase subunit A